MAQDMAVRTSPTPLTLSSLAQRQQSARLALASPICSPSKAAGYAKTLVGAFPNARPPDPAGYIASIAATLAQYPEGVAAECADPRTGIARTFRYQAPNVADVIEWCDGKLKAHRGAVVNLPAPVPVKQYSLEHRGEMLKRLADLLRGITAAVTRTRPQAEPVPTDEELRRRYPQAQEGV